MADTHTLQRNREAYMQVMRAFFMEDDDFSPGREALLIDLRKALQLDELIHLDCLNAIATDHEVTAVREALKASGLGGPGAAADRHVPAAPGPSSLAALSKPARVRPPKPRQPEPLPALPSYPSSAAWQDLPPPPPPRSKAKAARPAASAPRPAPSVEEPAWRQPSKRAFKAPAREGAGVPHPDAAFQARIATAPEHELRSILAALSQREADVTAQLADLDAQEAELQRQPPPIASRPSLPPAAVRKPQHAPVAATAKVVGASMEELRAMLQKLASREKEVYYQILDLGLPDDDSDLEAATQLRLKWHRLDRREHELHADLKRVEASLAAA